MKDFIKMLKNLISKQETGLTQQMRKKWPEMFWKNHPNLFVGLYMKKDFQEMETVDFLYKYLVMLETETSPRRKESIESVVYPMYRGITGINYDTNQFVCFGVETK